MIPYFIMLIAYIIADQLFFQVFGSLTLAMLSKIAVVSALLFYYRKDFRLSMRFSLLAVIVGLAIFYIWILPEGLYPLLGDQVILRYGTVDIMLKLIISVILAPVVEEFFTRFFLIRYLVDRNWKKVRMGTFTWLSFAVTVLFFGFSHSRWLPGLITGILLNFLYYREKNIESPVLAHAVANLALAIYVIFTGSWQYW